VYLQYLTGTDVHHDGIGVVTHPLVSDRRDISFVRWGGESE
jgi:hypothetical protein